MTADQAEMRIARLEDLPPGRGVTCMVEGRRVLVVNVGGDVFAVDDACTHDGAPLSEGDVEHDTIVCPWHFSRFCLRSGAVLESPAVDPLVMHQVRVVDGVVFLRAAATPLLADE